MRPGAGVISVPRYSLLLCGYAMLNFFLDAKVYGKLLLKHILMEIKQKENKRTSAFVVDGYAGAWLK